MTTNPRVPADVVIHWDPSAIHTPIEQIPSLRGRPVVNAKCVDVSKENVDRTFAEVFGYDIRVDPRTHSGACVRKSNENGTHDGVILTCPIAEQAKGYVYQRLLNNRAEDGFTEDIRIPVFGSLIPIVFRCKKEAAARFAVPSRIVRCCETSDVLSMEEIDLVLRFCQDIGLDYGELDVLRDRDDGRIYVVDANPTPWGPPAELAWRDQSYALCRMADAFEKTVLAGGPNMAIKRSTPTDQKRGHISSIQTPGQFARPQGHPFDMEVTPYYLEHHIGSACESFTATLLANLLTSKRLFIDVGAREGFYSLLAATRHSQLEVLTLTPEHEHYAALIRNIERNGVKNIQPIQKAAWDCNIERVEVLTIDGLLKDRPPCPTTIKISTGGHELEVLRGMHETLSRFRDLSLIIELSSTSLEGTGHSYLRVLEKLSDLGFDAYFLDDRQQLAAKDKRDWHPDADPQGSITVYSPRREDSLSLCFFSHSAHLSGAERSLLELVTELVQDHGCICTVVVPCDGPLSHRLKQAGAAVIYASYGWWCDLSPISTSEAYRRLRDGLVTLMREAYETLRRIDPDIVVTFTMVIPWGAIIASSLAKPHVWHICEHVELAHGLHFSPFDNVADIIRESSALLVTPSQELHRALFPDYADDQRIALYRHIPIPADISGEIGASYYARPGAVRLGVFAALCHNKGQEDAVRATAELVRRGHNLELLLVGPSFQEYDKTLEALIHECALEQYVRLTGFVEDVFPLMRATDIVVICSRHEGFGRTAVEGMLLGKPVIYPASGAFPEYMLDGQTGLAYSPGDWRQLAERVETLLERPEMRLTLGVAAKEFALKTFTREQYAGKFVRLVRALKDTTPAPISGRLLSPLLPALTEEIRSLQLGTRSLHQETRSLQEQIRSLQEQARSLQEQINADARQREEFGDIAQIQKTLGWRLLRRYWQAVDSALPPGSRRRRAYDAVFSALESEKL